MKKFLLSLAVIALGASAANAASLQFKVNGEDVENGAVVKSDKLILSPYSFGVPGEWEDDPFTFWLPAIVTTTNTSDKKININGTIQEISNTIKGGKFTYCLLGQCRSEYSFTGSLEAGQAFGGDMEHAVIEFEVDKLDELNSSLYGEAEYKFTFANADDASDVVSFTVKYVYDENTYSSVEGVEIDNNAAAQYYNLQGMPVANPEKGTLYIVKCGDKVNKTILK